MVCPTCFCHNVEDVTDLTGQVAKRVRRWDSCFTVEFSYIFREGEEANEFYIIRDGKVSLEIVSPGKEPIIIQTLESGEVLGWSWLVPPYYWHFDARAVEPTRVVAFDARCLRNKCEEDPKLGYELLKRLVPIIEQRLQATRIQLLDLYGTHS